MKRTLTTLLAILVFGGASAQSAKTIVEKAYYNQTGESKYSEMTMKVVRPDWSNAVEFRSWSNGVEYFMIVITAPARDKGQVFLKHGDDMWNYQPSIDRMIKLPPSMMSQSWMGSDFTNDDLIREASILTDYTHEILGEETIDGYDCRKIACTPKPDAPVVWGKQLMWIAKTGYYQIRVEQYDEDGDLVNTMKGEKIRKLGGKTHATKLTMIPADEPDNKTILEITDANYNAAKSASFFSKQNMKKLSREAR
ncbi:MAG: outer membrane lipoprotein-sorting protein [Ignavibacteriales bacterium]|nr:outer membrane lipoprotein-sorting protein [Ignavibacteriales bacterium]